MPRPITWTADLLERRRDLHSRIDRLALANPAAAARTRLELYSAIHRFDQHPADVATLDDDLTLLALELDALTPRAA